MNNKKTFIISLIFTIIVVALLLFSISVKDLLEVIEEISFHVFLTAFFYHLLAYIFRTLVLYSFFNDKKRTGFFYLLNVHFIHNFYSHILPARLGELSFPVLVRDRLKPSKSFSVLIITRVIFIITVLGLFIVSIIVNFEFRNYIKFELHEYIFFFLVMTLLVVFRKKVFGFLLSFNFIKKIKYKILRLYVNFKSEAKKLYKPLFLLKVLIYTVLNVFSLVFMYKFILNEIGIHLSILQIVFNSSLIIASVLLPIKSVGGFGAVEGAWALGMVLFGFSGEVAIKSGFVIHLIILINTFILFIVGLSVRKFFTKNPANLYKHSGNKSH